MSHVWQTGSRDHESGQDGPPGPDVDELAAELSGLRDERERLNIVSGSLGQLDSPADLAAEAERVLDLLLALADTLREGDPALVREVMRQVIHRIDVRFEDYEASTGGRRSRPIGGWIAVLQIDGLNVLGRQNSVLPH